MANLVVGCGYLGSRVAELWARDEEPPWVLTRSPDKARQFRERGWRPLVGDLRIEGGLPRLPQAECVLFSVGFDRSAGQSIEDVYVRGLAHVLDQLETPPKRLIYISTTGVYGEGEGDVIDELTPPQPVRAGARASWEAEQMLRGGPLASRSIVLRLAGIYGPDRLPNRQALEQGEPISADPDRALNLIHVEDAARVIFDASRNWPTPQLCNVSDGRPVLRREFYEYLAERLGAPPPRFKPASSDTEGGSESRRGRSDKRIASRHFESHILPHLHYRDYRDGLA